MLGSGPSAPPNITNTIAAPGRHKAVSFFHAVNMRHQRICKVATILLLQTGFQSPSYMHGTPCLDPVGQTVGTNSGKANIIVSEFNKLQVLLLSLRLLVPWIGEKVAHFTSSDCNRKHNLSLDASICIYSLTAVERLGIIRSSLPCLIPEDSILLSMSNDVFSGLSSSVPSS